MKKKIVILGSTGSIGTTSLKIIEKKRKLFNIEILSANKSYKKICKQIVKFKILEVDEAKQKIRLGIRELQADPFEFWMAKKEGDTVTVTVDNADIKLGVYVYGKDKNFLILNGFFPQSIGVDNWKNFIKIDQDIMEKKVELAIKRAKKLRKVRSAA